MPKALNDQGETLKSLHWPKAGIFVMTAFCDQPNYPVDDGKYTRSTAIGVNVRGFEPSTNRNRGGRREGLKKYIPARVAGTEFVVQDLNLITGKAVSDMTQQSQSGRVVTLVSVSQGNIYYANAGDTTWTAAANNTGETPPLNFTGICFSAPNQQKLWFVDGTNYVYFVPITNTVELWTATAGALPVDSDGNYGRLICTYRGRIVISGLVKDPQNWFMSAVDGPRDFDYSPVSPSATQAVAGNDSTLGTVGDVITALIPYNDDVLIFGGDHTIWMLRGDPANGGQIDRISDSIGIAWGEAWCKDPYGNIYFMSNRMGVFRFNPSQQSGQPERLSQAISQLLQPIDTGNNIIRMLWDDTFEGLHVFITPDDEPAPTTHYFWEERTGAWWQDKFANNNHNPLCCLTFDGNLPGDRVPLIGCWDGYVRAFDPEALDDDGVAIQSMVAIGPLVTPNLDDILVKDIQAVLGEDSGKVTYEIRNGTSAELALNSSPASTGTFHSGRNLLSFVRRAGHATYIILNSNVRWAFESIRVRVATSGKVRQRGE